MVLLLSNPNHNYELTKLTTLNNRKAIRTSGLDCGLLIKGYGFLVFLIIGSFLLPSEKTQGRGVRKFREIENY